MQSLSHSTRAFIVNADGLLGFLLSFDIIEHLKAADESGNLEHTKKFLVISMNTQMLQAKISSYSFLSSVSDSFFLLVHFFYLMSVLYSFALFLI